MKGDFSRLTFRPQEHYMRVLQQQGRPQLDADWNEQVAILLHRLEALTGDLTGGGETRSGAPFDIAGFEIGPITGEADNFSIGRGRYYVDGLCCECDEDTTYVAQPFPPGVKPDREGILLVYLDACEVVVGPRDDPVLMEPALSGLETTLRTRVVWQVRTQRLSHHHDARTPDLPVLRAEAHECIARLRRHQSGLLRVRLGGGGHFRGPENLLYRIEVHDGGPVGHATFKWSRENGAVLLPLTSLTATVAHVAPIARQAAAQLVPGTWVEFSDRFDRMLGRSRTMVQVVSADGVTGRIELSGSPAAGQAFKPGERSDIALRWWDQRLGAGPRGGEPVGPDGVPIVEGENEAHWLDVEDGIQIQFQAGLEPEHHYRIGDYWLVPVRTADEGILLRGQGPHPPDGVKHYYAPLALFVPQLSLVIADYRPTFLPLAALQDQVNKLSEEVQALRHQIAEMGERTGSPPRQR